MIVVENAKVYRENGTFEEGSIAIDGELFTDASGLQEDGLTEHIDAKGCYAIPGLIDLHLHGCAGHDFSTCDAAGIGEMARFQAKNGITSICPTTLTMSEEQIEAACRNIAAYQASSGNAPLKCGGATVHGIHLEGPFFSQKACGAQNREYLQLPDGDMLVRMQEAAGELVKIVAIAPELDGALDVISKYSRDFRFSIGHTKADYLTAKSAFQSGARQVTHLYNCMPPLDKREPGVVGAAMDFSECSAELICDGVHIHESVVRATFAMFGDNRIIMISDSVMATGMGDGTCYLGSLEVEVEGRYARLAGKETIAGSVTTLMGCLYTAVTEMNIPLASAVRCASANPAKALGVFDKYGSITPGKYADLVLLNEELLVKSVFLRGKSI